MWNKLTLTTLGWSYLGSAALSLIVIFMILLLQRYVDMRILVGLALGINVMLAVGNAVNAVYTWRNGVIYAAGWVAIGVAMMSVLYLVAPSPTPLVGWMVVVICGALFVFCAYLSLKTSEATYYG